MPTDISKIGFTVEVDRGEPTVKIVDKQRHNKPPRSAGRPKGTPNKVTKLLKDAILEAATLAGGKDGLVGYLRKKAVTNPGPFLALIGKVLPLQLTGPNDGPLQVDLGAEAREKLAHFIARQSAGGATDRGAGTTE